MKDFDDIQAEGLEKIIHNNKVRRKGLKRRGAFIWGTTTTLLLIQLIINNILDLKFATLIASTGLIVCAFGIYSYFKILENTQNIIDQLTDTLNVTRKKN